MAALMSPIPRRTGWTIAAQIGDRAPDEPQRLLSGAVGTPSRRWRGKLLVGAGMTGGGAGSWAV
jgi:hypothetical protein